MNRHGGPTVSHETTDVSLYLFDFTVSWDLRQEQDAGAATSPTRDGRVNESNENRDRIFSSAKAFLNS